MKLHDMNFFNSMRVDTNVTEVLLRLQRLFRFTSGDVSAIDAVTLEFYGNVSARSGGHWAATADDLVTTTFNTKFNVRYVPCNSTVFLYVHVNVFSICIDICFLPITFLAFVCFG